MNTLMERRMLMVSLTPDIQVIETTPYRADKNGPQSAILPPVLGIQIGLRSPSGHIIHMQRKPKQPEKDGQDTDIALKSTESPKGKQIDADAQSQKSEKGVSFPGLRKDSDEKADKVKAKRPQTAHSSLHEGRDSSMQGHFSFSSFTIDLLFGIAAKSKRPLSASSSVSVTPLLSTSATISEQIRLLSLREQKEAEIDEQKRATNQIVISPEQLGNAKRVLVDPTSIAAYPVVDVRSFDH